MYRTSYAGIRVPDLGDVVSQSALLNLFTDIELAVNRLDVKRSELTARRGAGVLGGALALPDNTPTNATFNTELWDTIGGVDIALAPTQVVVPAGVWLVRASALLTSAAALNTAYLTVLGTVTLVVCGNQSGPFVSATQAPLSALGTLVSPGETLTLSLYQRSGAAGQYISPRIEVAKICDLR